MARTLTALCASLCAFSLNSAFSEDVFAPQEISTFFNAETTAEPATLEAPVEPPVVEQAPIVKITPPSAPKIEAPFKPFTGKVKKNKVRLRLSASLESAIVKELHKSELLHVVGEKGNFWKVKAPSDIKTYVFRGLVLDNVVEANRVNVRIEPNLSGAVIGHLNTGDKVEGAICASNNKWIEMSPPETAHFYVAKEYLEYVGGPEFKAQADRRRLHVEQLIDAAEVVSKSELRKPFDDIDSERIIRSYNAIVADYADFPEYVEQAKESLASFQEAYIQKRINFLDARTEVDASLTSECKDTKKATPAVATQERITDRMRLWEPIEEALYFSWANVNNDRDLRHFYEDQKLTAVTVSGIVEPYHSSVKNKPGDYILRDKDLPVSYIYSTQVDLDQLVGKKVTLTGTPRPNNNFAFPAYFILSVE